MKLGIYSDIHWSTYSSILRSRGEEFSIYLEGLINSVNWAEDLFSTNGCDLVICAGDFLDSKDLESEEISALKKIVWNNLHHYFICGNHEMGSFDHTFSSTKLFDLLPAFRVIDKATALEMDGYELDLLPYILESDRKPIEEYFKSSNLKRILISHEDISGLQMGQFISKSGFSIQELQKNFDLVINGHLHNGGKVADKIFNIGSLSAINFSNDSSMYTYGAFILDTDTLEIDVFENPFAFNFYKLDATNNKVNLSDLKNNAVITIKCNENDANYYRSEILNYKNIIESRMIVEYKASQSLASEESMVKDLSVDHISEFNKFILNTIGSSDLIKEELAAIGE